jgi:hypothetical protein
VTRERSAQLVSETPRALRTTIVRTGEAAIVLS